MESVKNSTQNLSNFSEPADWSQVLAVATNAIPSIIVFSAGSSAERRIARNDGIGTEAVYS